MEFGLIAGKAYSFVFSLFVPTIMSIRAVDSEDPMEIMDFLKYWVVFGIWNYLEVALSFLREYAMFYLAKGSFFMCISYLKGVRGVYQFSADIFERLRGNDSVVSKMSTYIEKKLQYLEDSSVSSICVVSEPGTPQRKGNNSGHPTPDVAKNTHGSPMTPLAYFAVDTRPHAPISQTKAIQ